MQLRALFATFALAALSFVNGDYVKLCQLKPLGPGKDDTTQVLDAIAKCGHNGHTTFASGNYNITRYLTFCSIRKLAHDFLFILFYVYCRKMTWDLRSATVDLHGVLNASVSISTHLSPSMILDVHDALHSSHQISTIGYRAKTLTESSSSR